MYSISQLKVAITNVGRDSTVVRSSWPGGNALAFDASAALSSLTQATNLSGLVKCVATSQQWVTAVEDCRYKLSPGLALLSLV